jgi:hypothetical protein
MPCEDTIWFPKPQNKDRKIWRYANFSKFKHMIESKSLHFTSLNELASKFDTYEGHYPYPEVPMKDTSGIMRNLPKETFGNFDLTKSGGCVNCWHLNEDESYTMWQTYSRFGKGIAIQSTVQKLWDSFSDCKHNIFMGEVEYVDFEELKKVEWQRFQPKHLYLYKRKCFKSENELRVIVELVSFENGRFTPWKGRGADMSVDLNILIDRVWVSPYSNDSYKKRIEKILSKHGISKPVEQSVIDEKPEL